MILKPILKIISELVPLVISLLSKRAKQKDRMERQEKRNALAKNPGNMFADHFFAERVPGDGAEQDAQETDKADS